MARVFNKNLKRQIDKHSIISFDIFDTLIKRDCHSPTDIFEIVEKQYNKDNHLKIKDFKKSRIHAEEMARSKSDREDITLDDIYHELEVFNDEIKNELKQLEVKTEKNFCRRNNDIYPIYQYCKENNKKIICISDMYLDKETIRNILQENEYEIGEIYVSSEIGLTKRTSHLFQHVLRANGYKPSQLLHIGDSKRGDYVAPKMVGISSYFIPRYVNHCSYIKKVDNLNLDTSILYTHINNSVLDQDNEYYKIGYELLGPIIYAYCKWLHKQTLELGIQKLFFCARDMQFTQKIYNSIYKEKAIENEYLYISRKSIEQPFSYVNNSFASFVSTVTQKKLSVKDILANKKIEIENLDELLTKYQINPNIEYNNASMVNEKFEKFYNEIIRGKIEEEAKEQYNYFMQYMSKISFNPKDSALVDLGWRGTIQFSLQNIYKEKINGLYLGLEEGMFQEIEESARGFLFEKGRSQDISDKIYSFRALFEIFFSATHGTTLAYSNDVNEPYVLGKYENPNSDLVDFIQKGALDCIKNLEQMNQYIDEIDIIPIMNNLLKIGTEPSYKQARIFGEFNFDNIICGKLAKPNHLLVYICHPKLLKIDIFKSEWKVGFLKRLFKVKFPYYKFYSFLKKRRANAKEKGEA